MSPDFYQTLFAAFAFVLGAAIGSFLNVCIYRLPRDLSVNDPRRSYCPSCEYQIPWYCNLPLISWLSLRGKCANCGAKIAFRYFGVELLTGLLFLAVWWRVGIAPRAEWEGQGWVLALPFWVLASLLVVATFIDFEFFIIPDSITWGGVAAGLVLSFAMPILMGKGDHLPALGWSLVGAAAGYFLLWGVVEAGKRVFGKKAFRLQAPTSFTWTRREVEGEQGADNDADLVVGDVSWKTAPRDAAKSDVPRGESWIWSETFSRDSDRLTIDAPWVEVDGERFTEAHLVFQLETLAIGSRTWRLEETDVIRGEARSVIIPREAMGFGDVKFIAAIGAFLGWQAVGFTVLTASTVGAIIGLTSLALGRREFSAKIPFGPYLALGALVWIFCGPEVVRWYLETLTVPPAP